MERKSKWYLQSKGEVIEINPEVLKDPSLLRSDPYGRSWLAS